MSFSIYIDCGKGEGAYRVTLTAEDRKVFDRITKEYWAQHYKDEALVAGILAAAHGEVKQVQRHNGQGQLQDGPDNLPAWESFENGKIAETRHYRDGKLQDGADGGPAVQKFYGGKPTRKEYYQNGLRHDGAHGEPAIRRYNSDGRTARIERYKNGLRNDGARGEPAVQEFNDDGRLVYAASFLEGKYVRTLTQGGKPKPPAP